MAFKQMGQSRDVGLNHGPGKGSAPRNNSSKAFRDNFSEIDWSIIDAFHRDDPSVKRKGNKFVKKYK